MATRIKIEAVLAPLLLAAVCAVGVARADDDAMKSVELRLEGACDEHNSRLWLINNNDTKAVVAAVRWSLANSKRIISDRFQAPPSGKVEIGCAAKADIASASFVEPAAP